MHDSATVKRWAAGDKRLQIAHKFQERAVLQKVLADAWNNAPYKLLQRSWNELLVTD